MESLNKFFYDLKEKNISNNFKKCNFLEATKILTNKNLIEITNNLLNILSEILDINMIITPKIFLSSYLITFFSKDVLSSELNIKEKFIFDKSKELVDYIDHIDINLEELIKLSKKLNTYNYIFNKWKENDLDSQIEIYCDIYHDYENKIQEFIQKENESLSECINELKKLQNIPKNNIKKLIGNKNVEKILEKHNYLEKKYEKNIHKITKNYLKKIFWEEFKNNLNSDYPNYKIIIDLNKDILIYLENINNIDLFNQSKEYFYELNNNINNNLFSNYYILEFTIYLLNVANKCDSIDFGEKYNEFKINIDKLTESNFISEIVNIISFIMNRLELISDTIDKVKYK